MMKCPNCEHDNRTGVHFCGSCDHCLAGSVPVNPQTPPFSKSASFTISRCQEKRLLGEGSIKRVYLACDTKLDRAVAFFLSRAERLGDVARTRFSREARVMGHLLSA